LTTWLLVGPFSQMLAAHLPFHILPVKSTTEWIVEVVEAPATWVTLAVIAAGLAAWRWRIRNEEASARLTARFAALTRIAADGFGFEWINQRVVGVTQSAATALRALQTGQLNWNMVGIASALLAVLVVLAWGA
jgi:NADH-quinone oxidoreductase subunit L